MRMSARRYWGKWGGVRKELGLHKSYNNWQTNHIAALQMPGNPKLTRAKKPKYY
jgi:hypothetical protein